MELGLGLQVEGMCLCGLCDTAGHQLTAAALLANATNVSHRDQLKVTGWKRKREKNLPSSPGNAKQDPAEPNPLFSQPWASIYRTAKARPTLTSKVVAARVNLHGSCCAGCGCAIPGHCPHPWRVFPDCLSAKASTAHAHKVPCHSRHGDMKICAKKSKLRNSQRGILSSQKMLRVECGHWTASSCLAVPPRCDLQGTHRINCAIQDIPPLPPHLLLALSPRYLLGIEKASFIIPVVFSAQKWSISVTGWFLWFCNWSTNYILCNPPALPSQQGLLHLQIPLLFTLISQSCHSLNPPQICAGWVRRKSVLFFYLTNARGRDTLKQWNCLFFQ